MKQTIILASLTAWVLAATHAQAADDKLIAAAKAEGKVVVYSITSRISKAAEAFQKKYGIKVEASNLKDGELIEKISKEVGGGIAGADFVIAQDSGRVYGQLIATHYLVNYVPDSMKTVIPKEFRTRWCFSTSTRFSCSTARKPKHQWSRTCGN
jgi:iron(III) transport system substrate-binding protein